MPFFLVGSILNQIQDCFYINIYSFGLKDFSIEGTVVLGLLLCSKNLEQSKSPETTAPSIENSLFGLAYLLII